MTVVFSNGCLIIAGGNSAHGIIQTVDVLTVTCQDKIWREVACLPYKVFHASGCVCNAVADPGKMKGEVQTNERAARIFWGYAHFRSHVTRENPILSQGKSHNRLA